ncbi:MAG: methyl-accepting chemotaxis protein [Spirochaetota bacterium]
MTEALDPAFARRITIKLAITSFLIQAASLYSSEFFNSVFNNRYDLLGLDLVGRLPMVFKPTVFLVFLVAYAIQLAVMLITLRPMFHYLRHGQGYEAARGAAVKLPWRIVLIQTSVWIIGTTGYFAMLGWHTESGIPYAISLALKLGTGLIGALFNCVIANIHLLPAKRALAIVDIRQGERDQFARFKSLLILFASAWLFATHCLYLCFYFINHPASSLAAPYPQLLAWLAWFTVVSLGLGVAARFEHDTQMRFLKGHISRLLDARVGEAGDERVQLLYFDDVGEFAALFNRFMDKFRALIDHIIASTLVLSDAVQDLSTSMKEVSSTSNMQAAAVKEVVSTMEDSNTITQSIGKSIPEVARIAVKTRENVDTGQGIVTEMAGKMNEIRKKNTDTISGIRSLTDKIRAIWEIVDIINAIVEQTRIIAFNAALEASTAGEAGKNFRIVAGEIKLLADSTNQSTTEIQSRITEIQKAANSLIVVSEEGTERIRQGYELSDSLSSIFSEILDSAEVSATSYESIGHSIRQQAGAFEQTLLTLKEISRGIDNLVLTQQQTSRTAEALTSMAGKLRSQAGQFAVGAGPGQMDEREGEVVAGERVSHVG